MTLISIRDFRSNQGKYLGLAANGESVILTSRRGNFMIVPVTEDDRWSMTQNSDSPFIFSCSLSPSNSRKTNGLLVVMAFQIEDIKELL